MRKGSVSGLVRSYPMYHHARVPCGDGDVYHFQSRCEIKRPLCCRAPYVHTFHECCFSGYLCTICERSIYG